MSENSDEQFYSVPNSPENIEDSSKKFEFHSSPSSEESVKLTEKADPLKKLQDKYISIIVSLLEPNIPYDDLNKVAFDLLQNGRQKLNNYVNDKVKNVWEKQMEPNSPLLQTLTNYIEEQWSISTPWLHTFICEQKNSPNDLALYQQILHRIADSDAKYRSSLAILVQFLYRISDEKDFEEPSGKFHHIIMNLTQNGCKEGSSSDLLLCALKEYQRTQLFSILESCLVPLSNQDTYDQALECLGEKGWTSFLTDERIDRALEPETFRKLCEAINSFVSSDTNFISSSSTEPAAIEELASNTSASNIPTDGAFETSDVILTPLVEHGNPIESILLQPEIYRNLAPKTISEQHMDNITTLFDESAVLFILNNLVEEIIRTEAIAILLIDKKDANHLLPQLSIVAKDQSDLEPKGSISKTDDSSSLVAYPLKSPTVEPATTIAADPWLNERALINECQLFCQDLKTLVSAGELLYINEDLKTITEQLVHKNLTQSLDRVHNFPIFIHACLTPLMYLLKREQNLTDFVSLLRQLVRKQKCHETPQISLRLLIDVLLQNSESLLRHKVIQLLSKRNPVPMLEPAFESAGPCRFVPELLNSWNYSQPTLLSFSIAPCQGKSSLMNALFLAHFEGSRRSSYFDGMIDIDFGYHFIPPGRLFNIAHAHGQLTPKALAQYVSLFDGFLIHVQASIKNDLNLPIIQEFMKMLPATCYKIVIIRDVHKDELVDDDDDQDGTYSQYFPSAIVHLLSSVVDKNTDENKEQIDKLRTKIQRCIKEREGERLSENQVKQNMIYLLNPKEIKDLHDRNTVVDTIRSILLPAKKNDYPFYDIFVQMCRYRNQMSKIDFYEIDESTATNSSSSTESQSMSLLHLQKKVFDLQNLLHQSGDCGLAYDVFIEILSDREHRLAKLDLLSVELKRERDCTLSAGQLATDLSSEKCYSIEHHWRNAILCYNNQANCKSLLIFDSYGDYVESGKPFEIVDGDNFFVQANFLERALARFKDEKIFVLSIVGPQNSGKSFLLNNMFGTLFDVRDGRCTRGIYGSLLKSNLPDSDFKYILLIDTEGLMSMEKKDPEYDRRLVLFCLAVSHLVIINTLGDFASGLHNILHLCADSLKYLGVNKVHRPSVHIVLNQKCDPNVDNHAAAIKSLELSMEEIHADEWIKISKETFHTLPSAFDKKYMDKATIALTTQCKFIEEAQCLCSKFVGEAKNRLRENKEAFGDVLRWIQLAEHVFKILQQYPDLTLFNDVFERGQDERIQTKIREMITSVFTSSYSRQLLMEVQKLSDTDTRDFYRRKFAEYLKQLEDDLEQQLMKSRASDKVRKRSRRFLTSQLDGARDSWCAVALKEIERIQMGKRIGEGAAFLRTMIDKVTESGVLSKEKATKKFNEMWETQTQTITNGFNTDDKLDKAFKFVYQNYHIFEKNNFPDYSSIIQHQKHISTSETESTEEILNKIIRACKTDMFRSEPIQTHEFEIDKSVQYNLGTIKQLKFLYIPTLEDAYRSYKVLDILPATDLANHVGTCTEPHVTTLQNEDVWNRNLHEHLRRILVKKTRKSHQSSDAPAKMTQSVLGFDTQLPSSNPCERPDPICQFSNSAQLTTGVLNRVQLIPSIAASSIATCVHETGSSRWSSESPVGVWKQVLRIDACFDCLDKAVRKSILFEDRTRRLIDIDIIREVVSELCSQIKAIDDELNIFKLSVSKIFHSIFHTCTVLILTKFHYAEEWRHFNEVLKPVLENKEDSLQYFLRMVVPERASDKKFARALVDGLLKSLKTSLKRELDAIVVRQLNDDARGLSRVSFRAAESTRVRKRPLGEIYYFYGNFP